MYSEEKSDSQDESDSGRPRTLRAPRSPRGHPDRHVATDLTCIQKKSLTHRMSQIQDDLEHCAPPDRHVATQIATRAHRFNMYSEEKSDSQDESDSGCVTSRETHTRNYNVCFLQLRKKKSFGHRDSLQRLD